MVWVPGVDEGGCRRRRRRKLMNLMKLTNQSSLGLPAAAWKTKPWKPKRWKLP